MLGDTVAIEVPPDAAPALTDRARRSCETALGAGRCAIAHFGPEPTPDWRVVVTSDPDGRALRIVLRSARDPRDLRAERRLDFAERDPLERRWESAGAVIAALVAAQPRPLPEPQPEPPVAPVVLGESPLREGPSRSPWRALDLAALGGPGLQNGRFRGGALIRGWVGIGLPLVAVLELRAAASGGNPGVSWVSGAAGFGGRFGSKSTAIELSSAAIAQHMVVSAHDAFGRRDSGALWRFGGRLGLDGSRSIGPRVQLVVGAEVSVLRPGVTIEWVGVRAGRESPVLWTTHAGLRFVPAPRPP